MIGSYDGHSIIVAHHLPGYLVIDEDEAVLVRQLFTWLVEERMTIRQIVKRLNEGPWWPRSGQHPWQPSVVHRIQLSLRTREIGGSPNPPVLHRKEAFLLPDHALHAKFARLSEQEERHGLFSDTATIGNRDGWNSRLHEAGFAVRGHRLVRRKG
jgi:hypothetical protein